MGKEWPRIIFEENWRQLRYAETERQWFMNIYNAVLVASLGFLAANGIEKEAWPLFVGIISLSVLGYGVTFKFNAEIRSMVQNIIALTKELAQKKIR